jgi:hypothetical protein
MSSATEQKNHKAQNNSHVRYDYYDDLLNDTIFPEIISEIKQELDPHEIDLKQFSFAESLSRSLTVEELTDTEKEVIANSINYKNLLQKTFIGDQLKNADITGMDISDFYYQKDSDSSARSLVDILVDKNSSPKILKDIFGGCYFDDKTIFDVVNSELNRKAYDSLCSLSNPVKDVDAVISFRNLKLPSLPLVEPKNTQASNDFEDSKVPTEKIEEPNQKASQSESEKITSNPIKKRLDFWFSTCRKYLAEGLATNPSEPLPTRAKNFLQNQRLLRIKDLEHGLKMGFGIEILELGLGAALIPTVGLQPAFWITTGCFLASNWYLSGIEGVKNTLQQGCNCPIHETEKQPPEASKPLTILKKWQNFKNNCSNRNKEIAEGFKKLTSPKENRSQGEYSNDKGSSVIQKTLNFVDSLWFAAPFAFHKTCDHIFMGLGYEHHGFTGSLLLPFFASILVHVPISALSRLHKEVKEWEHIKTAEEEKKQSKAWTAEASKGRFAFAY